MCDVQTLFSNYSMDVHYIVFSHTVCVGGAGAWGHTRHINLYSRTHAPLSVVTASMPISRSRDTPSEGAANRRTTFAG